MGNILNEDLAAQYAVNFVTESNDQKLINKLIDFLMGETDGIPRVSDYFYNLFVLYL